MFDLKQNLFFAAVSDAKDFAKKLNRWLQHPRHSSADPREVHRMRNELRAAREHMRLLGLINRNRIF